MSAAFPPSRAKDMQLEARKPSISQRLRAQPYLHDASILHLLSGVTRILPSKSRGLRYANVAVCLVSLTTSPCAPSRLLGSHPFAHQPNGENTDGEFKRGCQWCNALPRDKTTLPHEIHKGCKWSSLYHRDVGPSLLYVHPSNPVRNRQAAQAKCA